MFPQNKLAIKVAKNFTKIKLSFLFFPFLLLLIIFGFLLNNGLSIEKYINIQKELFYFLNAELSQSSNLQFNLTQLGDVLIFFPFFTILIIYAPKFWKILLSSALISLLFSAVLKKIFAIPRPAGFLDTDSFVIIGKTLSGNTSLPSGHSIATFVAISVLLFALMPKKNTHKVFWTFCMILIGGSIAFSRVGVGAHYPLDVIIGSILGYISVVLGIVLPQKFNWWNVFNTKKFYPVFLILFAIWAFFIIKKIQANNLMVFYFAIGSLILTSILMIQKYVKKS